MEYMANGSLYEFLKKEGKGLNLQNIFDLLIDIASGLSYLHSRKIVHGDLKSPNVLLDVEMVAKVCDFGMSKAKLEFSQQMSMSHSVIQSSLIGGGTQLWNAPEIYNGKPHSFESDVYSFGIVGWEVVDGKGEIPFKDIGMAALYQAIVVDGERPKLPSSEDKCPTKLRQLIEACWNADPSKRPTAEQIVKALITIKDSILTTNSNSF